jgi:hypothetical protein
MDLTTGKFTAPRPGIYFFSFTGLANFPASSSLLQLGVGLYFNRESIGYGIGWKMVYQQNLSDHHSAYWKAFIGTTSRIQFGV